MPVKQARTYSDRRSASVMVGLLSVVMVRMGRDGRVGDQASASGSSRGSICGRELRIRNASQSSGLPGSSSSRDLT